MIGIGILCSTDRRAAVMRFGTEFPRSHREMRVLFLSPRALAT